MPEEISEETPCFLTPSTYVPFVFRNPYDHSPVGTDGHKITARIPVHEWAYIKRIFPMMPGLSDKLVSNLVKLFIDHIKQLEKQNGQPLDSAWTIDHPTYRLIADFFSDCKSGLSSRHGGPRDDANAANGIRETVCSPARLCSDPQSGPSRGGARPGREEEDEEEGFGGRSNGVTPSDKVSDPSILASMLAQLGIED